MVKPLAKALLILLLLAAAALAAALYATPSVSDARARADARAQLHGGITPAPAPPRRFVTALVATEDQRFFSTLDPGIDPFAVFRVGVETLAGHHGDLGGSTITQQLAKMLYSPHRRDLAAKLREVALALKLSATYSRPEILAMYANVAYYGDRYYGLTAAACGYFGKRPADLSWAQAAMLAGAVNAPSFDDPRRHPDHARARQAHVFSRLVAVGALTPAEAAAARAEPLALVPRGTGCTG
jgi:membrane peptidoglycan carboxypeptidase